MRTVKNITLALALAAILAASMIAPAPARADRWVAHVAPRPWHGGDMRFFHQHDVVVWRGGFWNRGFHDGIWGWWWVVGGAWYFYPRPIYPYPDPYTPAIAAVPSAPSGAAPTQFWYYCESSKTYYPYVASCAEGWKAVPATPAVVPRS